MLTYDPEMRVSAEQALQHPYFRRVPTAARYEYLTAILFVANHLCQSILIYSGHSLRLQRVKSGYHIFSPRSSVEPCFQEKKEI